MQTNYKAFLLNITDCEKTGFLLWKVNNFWQREFKKNFEHLDLTHSQLVLLFTILWVETNQAEVSQKNLSDETGIDPMTTSTVLRTLQKKGWIKRKFHKKDSRTKLISLTEEGKRVISNATKVAKEFNTSFFSSLKDQQSQFQENLLTLLLDDSCSEEINQTCYKNYELNNNIEKS